MFEKFTSLFEKSETKEDNEFDATQLAVASLMITTAKHDGIFDEIEKEEILKLINNYYKLTDESLINLFEISDSMVDNASDIHQFTSKINSSLDDDEKLAIIEMLWKIIIADGRIDDYENALVRKLSGLLYIWLLYTSPSPRDSFRSRMPSSA